MQAKQPKGDAALNVAGMTPRQTRQAIAAYMNEHYGSDKNESFYFLHTYANGTRSVTVGATHAITGWIDPDGTYRVTATWLKEETNMPNYIVIENTPGYLPEDDDPFVTDDYSAAVAYMNERADEYENDADANYRVERGWASGNNYAAVMVYDDDKTHDLGRSISVELCEDDDGEEN